MCQQKAFIEALILEHFDLICIHIETDASIVAIDEIFRQIV